MQLKIFIPIIFEELVQLSNYINYFKIDFNCNTYLLLNIQNWVFPIENINEIHLVFNILPHISSFFSFNIPFNCHSVILVMICLYDIERLIDLSLFLSHKGFHQISRIRYFLLLSWAEFILKILLQDLRERILKHICYFIKFIFFSY